MIYNFKKIQADCFPLIVNDFIRLLLNESFHFFRMQLFYAQPQRGDFLSASLIVVAKD